MLQMNSLELADLIQEELNANPVLEEVSQAEEVDEITENILDQNASGTESDGGAEAEGEAGEGVEESGPSGIGDDISVGDAGAQSQSEFESEESQDASIDAFEEVDYGREFQDYLDPGYRTQEIEYKEDAPSFEQFISRAPSLSEHLSWQLSLMQVSREVFDAAEHVIGNLDADGRLTSSPEELAALTGLTSESIREAMAVVIKLEPVGCGAVNVRDCLLAQLEVSFSESILAQQLVREHFEDLQPHRLHHLAKNTGRDLAELALEIDKIKTLDPYPGRRFSSEDPIYVAPEVYIEKVEDEYLIYFADDGSPRLRLSPAYQQILAVKDTSKETRDFIKEKVRSAVDLLRNIEHRRQTIYRVVECIVRRQKDFLDLGVEHLKPMMLKDVAEDIGMHLSTISRVVNRKYAHTPQGVIELRRFFSEGMLNEDGEEVSTRILKLRIKKMIEEEDTKRPLTDDEIAKVLMKEGVKLSRRTVAKYRDQLQIPGSRERRTLV